METASGSAEKEMGTIRDSIDFKLNELSQTWVGVWENILHRDDINTAVEMLTGFSEALGSVIEELGLFGTLGITGGGIALIKNLGRFKCLTSNKLPRIIYF